MSEVEIDQPDPDRAGNDRLADLAERVLAGEDVVLTRNGRPVIRLIQFQAHPSREPRTGGQWKGQVRISDDFDAPLPDELADAFGIERK